ncbi:MAG TPA: transglutaminaseTgpA domain-containing protein, partial [Streptosporangiaceae bacterium]|nr:transglutaminaseTgpA domain-containing protein [Streptosporangiaceae bacterium]
MNHRLTVTAALATAAASTGLFLLIMGGDWFWGGLGAIIVVAVIGTLTRLRVLPPVVCLLATLGALLLYLNLVYEAKLSFLHLFPTGASLAGLWRLGVQGLNDTQRYASPVPPLRGIVLLATAGIGLVAVLTDLIAVRLRRCALAGLPLLVLFSVPVASGAGKNTAGDAVVFCLGMAGYLALLSADGRERLRLWGRLVTPWTPAPDEPAEELGSGPSTRALAASGRRIGLAAVALALFVPVLVPSLQAHKIFPSDHHGPGFGPGSGSGGSGLNPIVQMTNQLKESRSSVVLKYHTNDPHPQ